MGSRYLEEAIQEDLRKKMVFLAGPRQVGKTTLAKRILGGFYRGAYYLWDKRDDRREILKAQWPMEAELIVLDELHKYSKWKQWIKGEFDKHRERLRFLVTGSARLDIYRKGGDSLQGRYHHYRLHPFSLAELEGLRCQIEPMKELAGIGGNSKVLREGLENLLKFSGFPEPIMALSEKTHRRWQKERMDRFFREDIRDLESVRDLSSLQILFDLIPERVGSPLSLNALREDLDVSHKAVTHWIEIFERLYGLFRIRPYTAKAIRGLKKEAKAYLWDWTLVSDEGARFENLIASHLLKLCHYLEDTEGYRAELFYLRDVDGREVDFLVAVDRKPWFAVEAKWSRTETAPALRYFGDRLKIPFLFQVTGQADGEKDFLNGNIRVLPAYKFLAALV